MTDPKPSLVERLFAEHRGALQTFFRRRIRSKADAAAIRETLPAFDGELDAAQRVARLSVVLKQLRAKCHAAIELRFKHGLSYREVALRLGASPQMAKKYVEQALVHCRRRMARLG